MSDSHESTENRRQFLRFPGWDTAVGGGLEPYHSWHRSFGLRTSFLLS